MRLCLALPVAAALGLAASRRAAANEPGMPRSERLFKRLDANKDGKLALDEMRPKAERRFLRLDADGDGKVSAAELDARLKQQMDRRKALLIARLDRDGDGEMTTKEVDAYLVEIFTAADGDKDGTVTLVEAQAYHKARMMERRKRGEHGHSPAAVTRRRLAGCCTGAGEVRRPWPKSAAGGTSTTRRRRPTATPRCSPARRPAMRGPSSVWPGAITPAASAWRRRLLNDAAEAEDVAQEVFLKLWTGAARVREPQALAAWLARASANLALDRLRQRRPDLPGDLPDVPDLSLAPDRNLDRAALSQAVAERDRGAARPAAGGAGARALGRLRQYRGRRACSG